jgi:hypothetical protein
MIVLLSPIIRESGSVDGCVVAICILSSLVACEGFVQSDREKAHHALLSSIVLVGAVFCIGFGDEPAIMFWTGGLFGYLALFFLQGSRADRCVAVLGAFAAVGLPPFVGFQAIHWPVSASGTLSAIVVWAPLVAQTMLVGRVAFASFQVSEKKSSSRPHLIAGGILSVLAFGFFWGGDWTGFETRGEWLGIRALVFSGPAIERADVMTMSLIALSQIVLLSAGVWLSLVGAEWARKRGARPEILSGAMDRISHGAFLKASIVTVGVERHIGERWIANRWMPVARRGIHALGQVVFLSDRAVLRGADRFIRDSFSLAGKTTELLQRENLRWQLFFGVGGLTALLIKFLAETWGKSS